jgi:hypothetical protein
MTAVPSVCDIMTVVSSVTCMTAVPTLQKQYSQFDT